MNYKEFLNLKDGYKLVMLPEHAGDDEKSGLIEGPDGADKYVYFNEYDNANFYKGDFDAVWQDDEYWDHDMDDYKSYCKKFGVVLWQRSTQPEELPFIDDEPSVQATLNERQSSYGCFEDVALVTENIIDALKQVNYSRMPKTHKMAMYMIASKMARIVNGDFNHKDSWHDMQGYAKLIEDLL
jgi:hypothetical protein